MGLQRHALDIRSDTTNNPSVGRCGQVLGIYEELESLPGVLLLNGQDFVGRVSNEVDLSDHGTSSCINVGLVPVGDVGGLDLNDVDEDGLVLCSEEVLGGGGGIGDTSSTELLLGGGESLVNGDGGSGRGDVAGLDKVGTI